MNGAQPYRQSRAQFSLLALFEYMTLCCLLAALANLVGPVASVGLMGFALAVAIGQGGLALLMLMASSLAADYGVADREAASFGRQFALILIAAAICYWYRLPLRQRWRASKAARQAAT